MKYGFAISKLCSVKRDCKERPIKDYAELWGYFPALYLVMPRMKAAVGIFT